MSATNIQTVVKVRPFIKREIKDKLTPLWSVRDNCISHVDASQNCTSDLYCFDHIFDENKTNDEVYEVVKPLVFSCLEGINATIFAYGQTSSGKTHTMVGSKVVPGIISLAVNDIFSHIEENSTKNFLIRCSYLEIYNEKINDLLNTIGKDLRIREDPNGVFTEAREEVVRDPSELFALLKKGMKNRKIGCTDMNERSSRSHTIFKLVIQSQNIDSLSYTESSLSLVDLAGSERVGQMNVRRERQAEGVCINKSLTTLGIVIRRLSENEQYINYRDSKLTRLLQDSLGGNSKTLIICTITLSAEEETKSTLEFAQRAKTVKNCPVINKKVTDQDRNANLCNEYRVEIEQLQQEKIKCEETINRLQGKLISIQQFTAGTRSVRVPARRHTFGHYNPSGTTIPSTHVSLNDSDDDENESQPVITSKSEPFDLPPFSKNEEMSDSPLPSPETSPSVPSISPSPNRKRLLDISHQDSITFFSLERQFLRENDEVSELRKLAEKLRTENLDQKQQNVKQTRGLQTFAKENEETIKQLTVVMDLLLGKPVENMERSLYTIEEDLNLADKEIHNTKSDFQADLDPKFSKRIEELQTKIKEQEHTIAQLQTQIARDAEIRMAETEILSNLANKLSDEKAKLYARVAELEQAKEQPISSTELAPLQLEISSLKVDKQKLQMAIEEEFTKAKRLEEEKDNLKEVLTQMEAKIKCSETVPQSELELENTKLKEQLDDVNFQLSGEQAEVERLNGEVEEQFEANRSLIREKERLEEINISYREKLEIQTKELNNLQEHLRILEQQHKSTTCQVEELEQSKKMQYQSLEENMSQKNRKLEEEIQNYSKIISEKEKTIGNLQLKLTEISLTNQQYQNLEENLAKLKVELLDSLQKNHKLEEEIQNSSQLISEKEETIENIQLKLTEISLKNQNLQECIVKLEERIDQVSSLEANKDVLETRINKLSEELLKTSHKNEEFENEITNYIKLNSENEQTIENLQQKLADKTQELENEVANLKTDYSNLQTEKESLEDTVETLQNKLYGMTNIAQKLETESAILKDNLRKYSDLESEKNLLECRVNSLQIESSELSLKVRDLIKENSQLKQELNLELQKDKKGEAHILQQEVSTLILKNQENENNLEKFKKNLAEIVEGNKKLESENFKLKGQVDKLEKDLCKQAGVQKIIINQTQTKNIDIQEDFHKLTKEREDLSKKVELETIIKNQKELHEVATKSLQAEVQQYKQKVERVIKTVFNNQEMFQKERKVLCDKMAQLEKQLTVEASNQNSLKAELELKKMNVENLQSQLEELVAYKKKMQDKLSENIVKEKVVLRLSDEGKPLLPSEVRKIKRQHLQDQRRGLADDNLDEVDPDCSFCQGLKVKWKSSNERNQQMLVELESGKSEMIRLGERNKQLEEKIEKLLKTPASSSRSCSECNIFKSEIDTLKEEVKFLDQENEDMLKIINEHKANETELYEKLEKAQAKEAVSDDKLDPGCSGCKKCKSRHQMLVELESSKSDVMHLRERNKDLEEKIEKLLASGSSCSECNIFKSQIDALKKEVKFLDQENEDMLKIINEHKASETELYEKLEKSQLNGPTLEEVNKKRLLEKDLEHHRQIVKEYKEKLAKMELRNGQMTSGQPQKVDKQCQATCDFHDKYKKIKQLFLLRRAEAKHLKSLLNIPDDADVLQQGDHFHK